MPPGGLARVEFDVVVEQESGGIELALNGVYLRRALPNGGEVALRHVFPALKKGDRVAVRLLDPEHDVGWAGRMQITAGSD